MNFISALLLIAASSVVVEKPVDYKTAYEKAQQGDKPLLVLVTAEWCPPCQIMKTTTIPALLRKDAFKDFHFATVDLDRDSIVARQLIGGRGVPQLIMFERDGNRWLRRNLEGAQTPARVEAFVAKANAVRIANAKLDKIKK